MEQLSVDTVSIDSSCQIHFPAAQFVTRNQITPWPSKYRGVHVEAKGMKSEERFDVPQGTLDLFIMRIVALGPIHGYAIAQRIQQMSREALQVHQGSLYPALHRLEFKELLVAKRQACDTGS